MLDKLKKFKKHGILGLLAIVSFIISFVIMGKLSPPPVVEVAEVVEEIDPDRFDIEKELLGTLASMESADLKPKEQQLDDLIREVRDKLKQLQRREKLIQDDLERLNMARSNLKRESRKIQDLRIELVSDITSLKTEKKGLTKWRTLIKVGEKQNLIAIAKMWTKMDPAKAAKIIQQMFKSKQDEQAAKIIYHLKEKALAAIMDEIKDPGMANEIINKRLRVLQDDTAESGKS